MHGNARMLAAIDFLRNGQSFNIGNIRLGISDLGGIEVAGWSQFKNIENLTKSFSLRELQDLKDEFNEILLSSPSLKTFIKNKNIEFALYFDDYGKASIAICSERDGVLKWCLNLE
ncbi:MAG: hypothetical protein E6Q24_19525 [Chitinophagaceae bacterium]|nr:MAG: hypothetical protein E6Q24_19525 [Chitinophagaceae bacterium]